MSITRDYRREEQERWQTYLKGHSISSGRVRTVGFGKNSPKYSNDTESGRAQNRRVEFLITANEKMKNDAKKEAGN